ncbi:MAG: hypothetical protein WC699_12610 [Bacteroidales bacterium]|jgi:opacity protein-like surface antigen
MRTVKIVCLFCLLPIIGINNLSAQSRFTPGIGLAIKASTNGLGGDVVYNFHQKMSLRLGYEQLGYKTDFVFEEQGIKYATNLAFKTGSISLLFDYYLAKYIFVTAGVGYNLFHADVNGTADSYIQFGDIQIPKEKIGTFNIQVDPSLKVSPYLGVGFGRTLGLKKKLGFAFQLGAIYQGSPNLTIQSTGLLSPTSNPDQAQDIKLENQISQYSVYPVLKLSLSYKILSF